MTLGVPSALLKILKTQNSEDTQNYTSTQFDDDQHHLLSCEKLCDDSMMLSGNTHNYDDIFSDDVRKQLSITRIMMRKMEMRSKLLDQVRK